MYKNYLTTGLETHTCKLAKCESKFSFASENIGTRKKMRVWYFILYQIPILVSKVFQPVYSKGSGKVKAPRNTDSLSCHVTAMAEKITFLWTKERRMSWVLCPRRGEGWTKFQPQNTIVIQRGNDKNCSKVGKTNCELDIGICELKLKPLTKVCKMLRK